MLDWRVEERVASWVSSESRVAWAVASAVCWAWREGMAEVF